MLGLLVGVSVVGWSAAATSAPATLAIEIGADAEPELDAKLVRRLIGIETADVDVPPQPGTSQPRDIVLFFRVVEAELGAPGSTSPKMLSVELWERGVLHGTRRVSSGDNKRLTARRIAQAAAQLVLGLRKRRLAETRRLEREARLLAQEAAQPKSFPIAGRLTLDVPAHVVLMDGAWLAGLGLESSLRFDSGPRVGLGVGLMAGAADHADGLRWFETSLSPGYDFRLKQDSVGFGVGFTLGAAVAQLRGVESVGGSQGQTTTWAARAVLDTQLNLRLSRSLALTLGTEVGALLRPLTYRGTNSEADAPDSRLSGLWLGLQAGIRVDPPGGL